MTGSATSAEAKPHTDTSHPTGGSLRIRRVLGLVAAIIALVVVVEIVKWRGHSIRVVHIAGDHLINVLP